jgi:molybdopterin converting factor small subunit
VPSQPADLSGKHDGEPAAAPGQVTVRYWAAARAAAQQSEDVVLAHTLADALAEVRERHRGRPRLGAVLAVSSFLIGDQPVSSRDPAAVRLADGDVIEVLPPFAGG